GDRGDLVAARLAREVALDLRMIGDEGVADPARDALVGVEDRLPEWTPARARPLDPVHVDDVRDATAALREIEDRRVVAEGQTELAGDHRVLDGAPVELRGSEPALARDRNAHPFDPAPDIVREGAVALLLAVH